jgi:hypothetical protein
MDDVPSCWKLEKQLVPVSEITMITGLDALQKVSALILPTASPNSMGAKIKALTEPKAAYVYLVPRN